MKTVQGKTVLVTGAARGMGRLFAERAIAEGAARTVLWDVDEDTLNATLAELDAAGDDVHGYVVDIADPDAIHMSAVAVAEDLGPVDVLINNAGIVRGNRYFWETESAADNELTMSINALGPMHVAREFLPGMINTATECRIVNMASAAGLTPNPRMAVYAASKWAVIGWSDSLRLELKQAELDHIKVTTVCPYYVGTGMFKGAASAPLLPILDPDDVVDKTWEEMLRGSAFVLMPRTVVLGEVLKGLLPIGIRDFIADNLFGIYHTMENFRGQEDEPGVGV